MLRNAQVAGGQSGNGAAPSADPFSPYLHFSLKDYSAQDNIPQFSRENTPLSQEAQLMTIARQLHRFRFQYIAIRASNVLDQIFLAQFLHRACPDARSLFFGADLLMVREIDNVPFIGLTTITPYPLIALGAAGRAYPDSISEAYSNAVSYTFWQIGDRSGRPKLQDYYSLLDPENIQRPSLWATAIGKDRYYPLAILSPPASLSPTASLNPTASLSPTASDDPHVLPTIGDRTANPTDARAAQKKALASAALYPSLLWDVLLAVVCLLCIAHTLMLLAADYWSPFTRDLAVRDNDQPRRRSMYIHVATAMLFSMAFVVSFPVLWVSHIVRVDRLNEVGSVVGLGCGLFAVAVTALKTREHVGRAGPPGLPSPRAGGVGPTYDGVPDGAYLFFNVAARAALIGVPCLWGYLCCTGSSVDSFPDKGVRLVGLCFCYRCIHPGSGVSPVLPVLLLLFAWYLWGVFQTLRLRFSESGRPRLPKQLPKQVGDALHVPLFVSDEELEQCGSPRDSCLCHNITCLLITREVMRRFFGFRLVAGKFAAAHKGGRRGRRHALAIDIVLGAIYAALLVWLSLFTPVRSIDRFLWRTGNLSCPYEFLVGVLFFPLIAVALGGWMRMILIWGALKTGVLERLENMPIRFAFGRLEVMGWMTMLRSGGLREQWRDMARGLESIRQMLRQPDLMESSKADGPRLEGVSRKLLKDIGQLRLRIAAPADLTSAGEHDYDFMAKIELGLAAFSQELLSAMLIPYWQNERTGLVETEEISAVPDKLRRSRTDRPGPRTRRAL